MVQGFGGIGDRWGGVKTSQKMKSSFFDGFYVMPPLTNGGHYIRVSVNLRKSCAPYSPVLAADAAPPFGTARMVVVDFYNRRHCAAVYGGAGTRLRCRHSGANAPRPRFSFFSREKKENKKSGGFFAEFQYQFTA